jgi:hypothetical protein
LSSNRTTDGVQGARESKGALINGSAFSIGMAIGMSMTYTIIISLIVIPAAYGMFIFSAGRAHLTISGNSIPFCRTFHQ